MIILAIALIWGGVGNTQTSYQMESGEMTIAGTSTIHDWESTVNEVQVDGQFMLDNQKLSDITGLKVTIPVNSIISGRGNTMDKKTWKALEAEEHPNIIYTLNKISKIENTEEEQLLFLNGTVNIAGVEQAIDLEVMGKALENGKMEFAAEKLLNMTEFDIVPPKALFGTLQTGEEITVRFTVVMAAGKFVE